MISEILHHHREGGIQAFDRCFNPNNIRVTTDKMRVQLLESRQSLVLGRLARSIGFKALHLDNNAERSYSGRDLLALEVAHLDIIPDEKSIPGKESFEEVAEACGVTVERLHHIKEAAERESNLTADAIVNLTNRIIADEEKRNAYSALFEVTVKEDTSPVVIAGILMSVASHEKVYRENGDRPYFSHPLATGQLYQVAWDEVAKNPAVVVPDRKRLHLQLFVNLLHDTVEDQIPKRGSFLAGDTSKVTPLLVRTVLGKLGETDEDAREAANDIMLLTKTRDFSGKKMNAKQYRGRYMGTIRSMTAKFCDTAHNRHIDVTDDPDKRQKTHAEYDESLEGILQDDRIKTGDEFDRLVLLEILEIAKRASSHEQFVGDPDTKNIIFGSM